MDQKVRRCGRVAIMGPPNAGKSTLLNSFLGQKVAIVTPKAQTTRNQITGILTNPSAQTIFMDTPGLTQVRGRLSKTMAQAVWQSLAQADVILPVLDAHLYVRRPEFLERDLAPVAGVLANDVRPVIVVANKIDLFAKSRMLPLLTRLQEIWPRAEIFPVSALSKDGLPGLVRLVESRLPEGDAQYPEDQLSTAPLRFMVAEIVREKLFLRLREEVPYGVAVEVERWEEDPERGRTVIHAVIYVARSMHKAMVIGKGGLGIKQIGIEARRDIIELVGGKVHLELWVKVRENRTEDPAFLRELGFA
ncbi:MAG: GTPase Era [Desulfovibrio sp.]|jgi:GTP-binding protein Era|nr:GTPase Era [Desulfovibrio sp.]